MATRDFLPVIHRARAGDPEAQLELGKHYLFGGNGLPRNLLSALYWLDQAARRKVNEAWRLIGEHIPYEAARHATKTNELLHWYEKAFEAGLPHAALTFAQLVFDDPSLCEAWRTKAIKALLTAAQLNLPEAQWLLAHYTDSSISDVARPPGDLRKSSSSLRNFTATNSDADILATRYALAERAWAEADYTTFLQWSLPLARELVRRGGRP